MFKNIARATDGRSAVVTGVRGTAVSNQASINELDRTEWVQVFRDIARATDERTFITGEIPTSGVGNNSPVLNYDQARAVASALVLANMNSLPLDWAARLSVGGVHLNFFIVKQLPVLPPEVFLRQACGGRTFVELIVPRVLELTYTAHDLEGFARDLGWDGPPFRWDEERRFLLRCELDALLFHLYLPADEHGTWRPARRADGCPRDETPEELAALEACFTTPRDAAAYIMDTFPIVRQKDETEHGEYRTRRLVLEVYDALQAARAAGEPWRTRLDPPPADPDCCHNSTEAIPT